MAYNRMEMVRVVIIYGMHSIGFADELDADPREESKMSPECWPSQMDRCHLSR